MRDRDKKAVAGSLLARTLATLICLLGMGGAGVWLPPERVSLAEPGSDLAGGWFAMRIESDSADWFNQVARADDIAIGSADALDVLEGITAGRTLVMVASLEEAEATAPGLEGRVDLIGYALERWPTTPAEEQAQPLTTVQQLYELASEHGLSLAVWVDRPMAAEYGPQLTSYVDLFVFEGQRLQADPSIARDTLLPLIDPVRQSRSKPAIGLQVRCNEGCMCPVALLESFGNALDGVVILYDPSTRQTAQDFAEAIQSGAMDSLSQPTPPAEASPDVAIDRMPASPTSTAEPLPVSGLPPIQCTWPAGLVVTGGALMATRAGREQTGRGTPERGGP